MWESVAVLVLLAVSVAVSMLMSVVAATAVDRYIAIL